MNPSVKLLAHTTEPVKTLYSVWQASKTNDSIPHPANILRTNDLKAVFRRALRANLPVTGTINFVFLLENIPISLREQIVRHRVGHRFDDRLGVDIIPEFDQSSWWSQSARVLDLREFAERGEYYTPESLEKLDGQLQGLYHSMMKRIGACYGALVAAGMPVEDARQLLPLGTTHRITWQMNLRALVDILSKRTCWIAQLSMWRFVIQGMLDTVRQVDPLLAELGRPPCHQGDCYSTCPFAIENVGRLTGKDPGVPCPLFLYHESREALRILEDHGGDPTEWHAVVDGSTGSVVEWQAPKEQIDKLKEALPLYAELWGIDDELENVVVGLHVSAREGNQSRPRNVPPRV